VKYFHTGVVQQSLTASLVLWPMSHHLMWWWCKVCIYCGVAGYSEHVDWWVEPWNENNIAAGRDGACNDAQRGWLRVCLHLQPINRISIWRAPQPGCGSTDLISRQWPTIICPRRQIITSPRSPIAPCYYHYSLLRLTLAQNTRIQ